MSLKPTSFIKPNRLQKIDKWLMAHQEMAEALLDSPNERDDHLSSSWEVDGRLFHTLDEKAVEENGILFKYLVHIKFATETRKTVLFQTVREFVTEAQERCRNNTQQAGLNIPETRSSEDSSDRSSYPAGGPNSVSTSLFKSITHSANTEALIVKTVRSLLAFVRSAVFHAPYDSHCNWKGSLLEKTCAILGGSQTDAHCRAAVTAFLETSLDELWSTDDMFMSYATEHQFLILNTLCKTCDVCSSAINNIMLKCEQFVVEFSGGDPPPPSSIHKVEKMPHFLSFVERLLAQWMRLMVREKPNDSRDCAIESSDQLEFRDDEGGRQLYKSEMLIRYWRATLESFSVSCLEEYPLVCLRVIRLLSALDYPNKIT